MRSARRKAVASGYKSEYMPLMACSHWLMEFRDILAGLKTSKIATDPRAPTASESGHHRLDQFILGSSPVHTLTTSQSFRPISMLVFTVLVNNLKLACQPFSATLTSLVDPRKPSMKKKGNPR